MEANFELEAVEGGFVEDFFKKGQPIRFRFKTKFTLKVGDKEIKKEVNKVISILPSDSIYNEIFKL